MRIQVQTATWRGGGGTSGKNKLSSVYLAGTEPSGNIRTGAEVPIRYFQVRSSPHRPGIAHVLSLIHI